MKRSKRRMTVRAGFTLLELMLSMAISTIVIAALFMTIDLQLRIADEGRLEVEQAQLAHVILNRIADDLRNTVIYEPQDMSSAMTAVAGSSALAGVGASAGGGGDPPIEQSGDADSPTTAGSDPDSDVPAVEEELPNPGLYGSELQIQMDVSRIPRVDEYVSMVEGAPSSSEASSAADLMSDIKTVTYYVLGQENQMLAQTTLQPGPVDDGETGLYYRSVNRAATEFAAYYGNLESIEQEGVIISERISALNFEYFDGTEWVIEWDSTERQGNPVAVRIIIEMYPIDWEVMTVEEQRQAQFQFPQYQTVVWLPTSKPTTSSAGLAALSSDAASSDSSSSSSSQDAGGGSSADAGGADEDADAGGTS
ncbi:MAG: prepilin-type N-terminal cleavage/methylation domain-containing protein [Pirellulales bacterium]|nr:prepilin-type N-terminal cleavage/methylation domain-containing protein [Pirellulales bacterium]